jgi:hypothetical protein
MEGGAYTGRFNSSDGYIKASHFIELLEFLNEKVENLPLEQFWDLIDSLSIEERKEKIKKSKKRDKRKVDKFNPDNLKKPKNPINLFRINYKENLISQGKKYNQEDFNKAWKLLSDDEKLKYETIYNDEMVKYNKDYEKAKVKAINAGEYQEPEPKKPLSGYMLFLDFSRRENSKLVPTDIMNEITKLQITKQAGKLTEYYKKFMEDEKNVKLLEDTRIQYKDLYNYDYYHWYVRNLSGKIKQCEREGKDSKYLEKELEEYKNNVLFDTSESPKINVDWIYTFNNSNSSSNSNSNSNNVESENVMKSSKHEKKRQTKQETKNVNKQETKNVNKQERKLKK